MPIIGDHLAVKARIRTDPLAFIALGGALLACCPAAAIGGVAAGCISLARIAKSDGALRGKTLALGSIIASLIIGGTSSVIGTRFQESGQTAMNAEVRAAVDQLLATEVDPSAWWVGADPQALLEFRAEVRELFGPLTAASVTQVAINATLPARAHYRVLLESPSTQLFASVEVDVVSDVSTMLPSVRLRSMAIGSPDDKTTTEHPRPLAFPATSDAATPATLSPK